LPHHGLPFRKRCIRSFCLLLLLLCRDIAPDPALSPSFAAAAGSPASLVPVRAPGGRFVGPERLVPKEKALCVEAGGPLLFWKRRTGQHFSAGDGGEQLKSPKSKEPAPAKQSQGPRVWERHSGGRSTTHPDGGRVQRPEIPLLGLSIKTPCAGFGAWTRLGRWSFSNGRHCKGQGMSPVFGGRMIPGKFRR